MRKHNASDCRDTHARGYAMDHADAVRMKATERYLLGELTPREYEAFEEHFFECPECAADVRLGFQFGDAAKAVFGEDPQLVYGREKVSKHRWLAWMRPLPLAQAACVALVALIGYQNLVSIPQLRSAATAVPEPEVVPSVVLAPSSRGVAPAVMVPAGAHSFHLALDVRPVSHFEKYGCELRSSSGASLWKVPIGTLDPEVGIHLSVPAKALLPGSYEAVVFGIGTGETTELDHYRFDVRSLYLQSRQRFGTDAARARLAVLCALLLLLLLSCCRPNSWEHMQFGEANATQAHKINPAIQNPTLTQ